MLKIKQLLNQFIEKTSTYSSKEDIRFQSENSTIVFYEYKIKALELETSYLKKELQVEREANILKDNHIEKLSKSLEVSTEIIEDLKGTIRKLQADRYGISSEQDKYLKNNLESNNKDKAEEKDNDEKIVDYEKKVKDIKNETDERKEKRKKGGQKGHKGSGRRIPKDMRKITFKWELPEDKCKCPICGKKYRVIEKFQRKSHEIALAIEFLLKEHLQEVYEKECNCDKNIPELIVAEKPQNIIYKSVYSTETWCKLLALKYLTGLPVNRFNELTNDMNYTFNPATVIGGFEKLLDVMNPLYDEILKYNQAESHWHADETRWCRMLDCETKENKLHWMWVFVGGKSVVYVIDPTRSSKVPENHFKNSKSGILNVDRLPSYNIVGDKIILAYCWYHLRRDFINVGKKHNDLAKWSISWLLKIREIERINRKRVSKFSDGLVYDKDQENLCEKVVAFFNEAKIELQNNTLNKAQIKVLKNMVKKMNGYNVFVEYPWVPMHNNVAERQFRHIAFARNNYGGSKSLWGGELAAITWTIFKTAQLNEVNPILYLEEYFKNYISSDGFKEGFPSDLLPWNYKKDFLESNLLNSG